MGVSFGELVNSGAEPLPTSNHSGAAKDVSFAEIVCPEGGSIEQSDFARHFRAKQTLHIEQGDRRRFEYLLSWERINELLSLNAFDESSIRVTRDGRDVPPSFYRGSDGKIEVVNASKLHDLVKQNASVALNSVQMLSPPIRRLANQFEIALGQTVWVNCYMTFGAGGAFATHFDAHDVLVLQLQGAKRWFIYDDPEPAPLETTPKKKPAPERNVALETDLQAGDVLYVPRGTYHRAAVTDTDSLHLTFGMHSYLRLNFLERLRKLAEEDRFFREDLLMLDGPEAFAEQEKALKARICELVNEASLLESVERWQLKREPVHRFHLGPKRTLGDETVLAPLLRSRQAWRASLQKQGKKPSAAGEALIQSLLERNFATVADLKAELGAVLDEDMILSTVAELLDDCWIEVVRDSGGGSNDG